MNLIRYRFFCLIRNGQFRAVLPILLLISLGLSRMGNGHLFLIPSVLCCLIACGDYDRTNLRPVLFAGFSRWQIHLVEIWWILGLNLLLCLAVVGLHIGIFAEDFQGISILALCKLLLLATGNACVFLFLAVYLKRKEALLVPGFLMTVLEAGVQGNYWADILRNLFPAAGLSTLYGGIYTLESLALLLLVHLLPLYLPSKIHAV